MNSFLLGAVSLAAFAVGLFFFRYWRLARDRFFFMFGLAFCLLAAQWALIGALHPDTESQPWFYMLRLAAFLLIIAAIVDKNRSR